MTNKKPTGYTIYEGPSMLDGMPIVCIVVIDSDNEKTGNMAQVYFLRKDIDPVNAIREGLDASICGNCKHRGNGIDGTNRTCYVKAFQGPNMVYKAYKAGNYPRVSPAHRELQARLSGRMVRLGAYGDPASVPTMLLRILLRSAKGHTGYTHQWEKNPELKNLVMASVDNPEEYAQAVRDGWRTFRGAIEETLLEREIFCVNYTHGTNCETCGLCNGNGSGAKNVVIPLHGGNAVMANVRKRAQEFA